MLRRLVFSFVAEGLAFLRTDDATESDTFRMGVVQDFNGIAVEDGDDGANEAGEGSYRMEQTQAHEQYNSCVDTALSLKARVLAH
jgi:hypothetical protein